LYLFYVNILNVESGLPFVFYSKTRKMKKIFILLLMVIASVGVMAQTTTKRTKKVKKKHKTHWVKKNHKKSTDTTVATGSRTVEKTRGLDKGSVQGRTMKQKHRSERSQDGIIVETPEGPMVTGGIKAIKGTKTENNNGKISGKSTKYSYRKRTVEIGTDSTTAD
jgi:hypothetical protein